MNGFTKAVGHNWESEAT